MLRFTASPLCLACCLAAAAAGAAQAQSGIGTTAMRGPDTGGTGYATQLASVRPLGAWKAYGHVGYQLPLSRGFTVESPAFDVGVKLARAF